MFTLRAVSFDNVKTGYTKEASVVADENGLILPILERIDLDISEVLFNVDVQKEQARVEVFNGTSYPGFATKKARVIANTGAKVINVGNSRDLYEKTTIYVSDPENYVNTINEINNLFDFEPELIEEEFPYRHTGDIVFVIGNDAV